jgi:hypothetical protein
MEASSSPRLLVGGGGASLTLEGPAGPVGGTLRWVPADERDGPLVEGRGMNTAGRSQAFVGLEVRRGGWGLRCAWTSESIIGR